MKPDCTQYDPEPQRLRYLIARSGMSERQAASRIGIAIRALRYYLLPEDSEKHVTPGYPVLYTLEGLAFAEYPLDVLEACANPAMIARHLHDAMRNDDTAEPARRMAQAFIARGGRVAIELHELERGARP
ncbi:MAG TPA: hypothetical protein VIZ86_16655 [Pseudomonas sp.]